MRIEWRVTHYINLGADEANGGDFDPLGWSVVALTFSDISASYQVSEELMVPMGIDNIFDKKAPYLTVWKDTNTDVMNYIYWVEEA